MKRAAALLIIAVMLLSTAGCKPELKEKDCKEVLDAFTDSLRVYDREAMAALLTEFPDHSLYVYLDDIFNDAEYVQLYQKLFPDITYAVKSYEKNSMVVEYTLPDIQNLYSSVSAAVLNMILSDDSLKEKLQENEKNGIILIQQIMLAQADKKENISSIKQDYTIRFTSKDGKVCIICDDEIRALMTGNFFLSKNMRQDEIGS